MKVLTQDSLILCEHALGRADVRASQGWVSVAGRAVLVRPDPETKAISACPNVGVAIKPCTLTLPVLKGYSSFVRIDGAPVCLDAVTGLTDGTPPGVVRYSVKNPGQDFVSSDA